MKKILSDLFLILMLIVFFWLLLNFSPYEAFGQTPPYLRTFNRNSNPPKNVSNASELSAAINSAQPGELILLADGIYTGDFNVNHPDVMIQCLGHCTINGHVDLTASNTWLMGVEVYAPTGGLVDALASDTVVVGNYLHSDGIESTNNVCYFTSENGYSNQIAAFNIFRKCGYGAYVQHDAAYGTEYIVGNYIGEPPPNSSTARSLQAYSQSPHKQEAFYIYNNIFNGGEATLGGEGSATIPIYNVVKENLLHHSSFGSGYKRPSATDFIDDWFLNSILMVEHFYGVGEGLQPPANDNSAVTGNHFYNQGQAYGWDHFRFKTSAYDAAGTIVNGTPGIRPVDVWDNNTYHVMDYLRAPFYAGGINTYLRSLTEWQNASQAAGKMFDANGVILQGPPAPGFKLIQNEYDATKALLAIYAFNGAPSVTVTFPHKAYLRSISDPFGAIVASGKTIDVSTSGLEFAAYSVMYELCDIEAIELKRQEIDSLRLSIDGLTDQINTKLQEQQQLIESCQQ